MKTLKNTKTTIGTTALIAALGLTLTACSTDTATPSPTTQAVTQTAEPTTPVETPAELPDVYFPGADIRIPIDPALPIQEDVIEAVRAETTANADAVIATNPPSDANATPEQSVAVASAKSAARGLSGDLSEATGRTVFVVYQNWGGDDAGLYQMTWGVTNSANVVTGVYPSTDKDKVVADITAWVAAQPDPSAFEIIVT